MGGNVRRGRMHNLLQQMPQDDIVGDASNLGKGQKVVMNGSILVRGSPDSWPYLERATDCGLLYCEPRHLPS